jgi:hypothetical protein
LLFTGEKDVLNMWVWKMQEILFFCTLSAWTVCNKGMDLVSIFSIKSDLINFIHLIDYDIKVHLIGWITSNLHMKLHRFNEMNETIKYDWFCNVYFKASEDPNWIMFMIMVKCVLQVVWNICDMHRNYCALLVEWLAFTCLLNAEHGNDIQILLVCTSVVMCEENQSSILDTATFLRAQIVCFWCGLYSFV